MRPVRTGQSSMSCPASIRRAARCSRSSSLRRRTSTTTSCCAMSSAFPSPGRSYYEEVLVVRVHEEILKRQKLPPTLIGKRIWDERLSDIAPAPVVQGAEKALHGSPRQAGEALEILGRRYTRAPVLGRL